MAAYWDNVSHLTPYAQKYGQAYVDLFNGNSGLTPTDDELDPRPFPRSVAESIQSRDREYYQRFVTGGFTVEEVLACEAAERPGKSVVRENNLTNEICPAFARENWSVANLASQRWRNEFNFTDNMLWEAMVPTLRLASHMLTSNYTCDWWDGLVMGPREDITPDRLPDQPKRRGLLPPQRFLPRSPSDRHLNGADWRDLTKNITWRVCPGIRGIGFKGDTGIYQTGHMHGVCRPHKNRGPGHIQISVAYEEIRPLMPSFLPRISTSDRLKLQFHLAITYLHELSHAVNSQRFVRSIIGGEPIAHSVISDRQRAYIMKNCEPYYMDEFVSELGYSMENSLLGSHFRTSSSHSTRDYEKMTFSEVSQHVSFGWAVKVPYCCQTFTYPDMGLIKANIYNQDDELKNIYQIPGHPPMETHRYPIGIAYFEEVQQESFWREFVTKYGGDRLKIGSKFIGWSEKTERYGDSFSRTRVIGEEYMKYTAFIDATNEAARNGIGVGGFVDREVIETGEAYGDDKDFAKAYRVRKIMRERRIGRAVYECAVRQANQARADFMALLDENMNNAAIQWEEQRGAELRHWDMRNAERQMEDRRLAEQYPEYVPPMATTFTEYRKWKRLYEEARAPWYASDNEIT